MLPPAQGITMSTAPAIPFDSLADLPEAGDAMLCIPVAAQASLDGFMVWINEPDFPEGVRACWHEGDILLDMSPEEIASHNQLKTRLYRLLDQLVEDEDLGLFCSDGVSLVNKPAKVAAEPDGMFIAWQTLESERATIRYNKRQRPTAIEGSPDLVLEVVSESSVDKDLRRWPKAYHRAGVKEYWIIDGRGPGLAIQILKWTKRGYTPLPVRKGTWTSAVLARRFSLTRTRGRFGFWNYRFEVVEEK
jgi:Uma2 family endonuclease